MKSSPYGGVCKLGKPEYRTVVLILGQKGFLPQEGVGLKSSHFPLRLYSN